LVRLQIWDTAGEERFRSITSAYYRGSKAAILHYDISDRTSFEHVAAWAAFTLQHTQSDLVLMLVGCKGDLLRGVSYCEGAELAQHLGALFVETSAKEGSGVEQAFHLLALRMARLKT